MKEKYQGLEGILGIVLFACMMAWFSTCAKKDYEPQPPETINDTVWQHDTLTNIIPITKTITRHDTAYLPLVRYDSILVLGDTIHDSVFVDVPITTAVYDTTLPDSVNIKIKISGFEASLDSVWTTYPLVTRNAVSGRKKWLYGIIGAAVGIIIGVLVAK